LKALVTGSRVATAKMIDFAINLVKRAEETGQVTFIVGDAEGIDAAVIKECDARKIPVRVYGGYGRFRRKSIQGDNHFIDRDYLECNRFMVQECNMCIAVWNGRSRGTYYTFQYAKKMGKEAHLRVFKGKGVDNL
jgi:hypothetical protein